MERFKLPNKKEFERIVEEAFSVDERHSFSEQYKQKKDNIQRGIIMKKINNKPERIFVGTVAAAVLAVVAVPTGVVMKNKLDPQETVPGTDENAVIIENTENPDPAANVDIAPEFNEEPKTYEFGWMPDNMTSDGWKYHDDAHNACITPMLYKYTSDQELLPRAGFPTATVDEYPLEGRNVKIFYSCNFRTVEPNSFERNVWITFEGSQYAVFLYVSDGVDDEDLTKIIENISLVPADEDNSDVYEVPDPDERPVDGSKSESYETPEGISSEGLKTITLGETFTDTFDFWDDHTTVMDVTPTDAYITGSFDGITTDCIGLDADYSNFTDENGNIIDCYTEWFESVQQPDGTYKKEIIDTETVGSKILVVDMTLTNRSDAVDEYNIHPTLVTDYDGKLFEIDKAERAVKNGDCSRYCNMDELFSERHWAFSLSVNGTKGTKNAVVLEPGESAEIRLAFLLREDEVDGGLYLSIIDQGFSTDDESYLNSNAFLDLSGVAEK